MRKILFSILFVAGCMIASAQQKFMLPNANPQVKDTEHEIEQYGGISILGVVNPSVEVYLPEASKANGCAVILCPGGGLRALSWTSDVIEMAKLLNENGYAAIGLKYHLNSGTMQMPKGMKMPPMVDVTGFANFKDADCNPAHFPQGDSILALAANDANAAMRLVREHAAEWKINKVGYLGFSAGGGVAFAATNIAKPEEMPDFICTNFGPALCPVKVPNPAPPLLIMSRVDHPNVAAGLVSLFMEWKKAGGNAESHLYGDGKGPYQLMPQNGTTTTEAWSQQFLLWLKAKDFCDSKK
ncbi:MAG: hypothetical protein J5735_06445 [Prevotella sp.]|nr:hypothetical protein [Prevotella sp.]